MTNLLEVAKALEQTSKAELESTREATKNAIKQQEESLIAQLKDASKNLESVIQAERARLIKRMVMLWRLPSLVMGVIMALAVAITAWLAYMSNQKYAEMMKWKLNAANYQAASEGLIISRCKVSDDQSQYCIKIDLKHKGKYWGKQGELAILPITVKED